MVSLSLTNQKLKEGPCTHSLRYMTVKEFEDSRIEDPKCKNFENGCLSTEIDREDTKNQQWYCKRCKHSICLRCLEKEKLGADQFMVEMEDSDLN